MKHTLQLKRRSLTMATAMYFLTARRVFGQTAPPKGPIRPMAEEFRTIAWADLIPKGWDPVRSLGVTDLGKVNLEDAKFRKVWDNAPTNPRWAGQRVKLLGYLVPLDESAQELREFLLVAEWGACIHTPAPPANQIVHVNLAGPVRGLSMMDAVNVWGTMAVTRDTSGWGASGYRLEGAQVNRYTPPGK